MTEETKVPSAPDSEKKAPAAEAPKPKPKPAPKPAPVQEQTEASEDWQKNLLSVLGDKVQSSHVAGGEFNIIINNDDTFLSVFETLKAQDFDYLSDISSVDYRDFEGAPARFGLSYHLYSLKKNVRLRVKVYFEDSASVPSVMGIWQTADFHEREAYDLMGFHFSGRDGLKRILLPEDWVGHPLRKDFKKDEGRDEYTDRMIRQFKEDE